MDDIIKGKAFVLGNDIDTDQIIPAHHLVYRTDDEEERKNYGRYALSGVPEAASGLPHGHIPFVKDGWQSEYTIIIGGKNFGCGSSREHAPLALNIAGLKAVVAESYARIFFRNSVNGGYLVPFETPARLVEEIKTGDEVEIDVTASTLTNHTQGKTYALNALGDVEAILRAGDVFAYAKAAGMM
ncbi:MAG: 3-isopropylmalate dehydratase [bacterium]|jgi:3-isopropylmalate/(R)-2-methylmalate dehydratase small subunit|nr:3-isopropylmalate dehydratase [bacterium]